MPLNLVPPGTRKGNRFYLARGSVAGSVYEFNTYTTEPKVAARRARELEAGIKEERRPVDPGRITFAEAVKRYVEFRNPSRTDRLRLDRVVREIGSRRLRDIRPADVHETANRLGGHLQPATRNRELVRPIVTVLHHAADAGLCDWIRVRAFKEPRPRTRAVDPGAAAALIGAARPGAQRCLLTWLFYQGTRISDTLRLQWEDIDMRREIVVMPISKTGRTETFPLHTATHHELSQVPEVERVGPVFPWSNKTSLRRWLPQLGAEVGIKFTPHMARHTLGTLMAASGANQRAIMAALGHSNISSSARYQGADIEMVRAATNRVQLRSRA